MQLSAWVALPRMIKDIIMRKVVGSSAHPPTCEDSPCTALSLVHCDDRLTILLRRRVVKRFLVRCGLLAGGTRRLLRGRGLRRGRGAAH